MGQIKRDCPHCNTRNTAFITFGECVKTHTNIFTTALFCAGCFGGICAEIERMAGESPCNYHGDIDDNQHMVVRRWYPLPEQAKAPKHLQANVEKFFLQAVDSLKNKNYDASAMMSRKSLEVAVKTLAPGLSGNLYNRIEQLAQQNLITPDLKDWAHIIRDDGNVAAHEEEPVSPEFAQELLSFTEMFLMYTFTMPALVKERRHHIDGEQT